MEVKTKNFGLITVEEDKIIHFVGGILGFPDLTRFLLVFDEEKGNEGGIQWLQSLEEGAFAIPVIDPLIIDSEYNPMIEDDLLMPLGELHEENLLVLTTITVPDDITKMTVNLKGPIIINVETKKACQVIIEDKKYKVKYPVYELLKARKGGE